MQDKSQPPRRRLDPLALTVMAVALAAVVGIASYLVFRLRSDAPPPEAGDARLRDAVAEVEKWIEGMKAPPPPVAKPPVAKPAPPPSLQPAPQAAVPPPPRAAAAKRFQVTDLRPPKEKRDYDAGEAEGYQVLGDDRFIPDRVSVLHERLAAKAGERLAGKQLQLTQLISWYVRTPKAALIEQGPGMPRVRPEEVWRIPQMRDAEYWIICDITLRVDGQQARGRSTRGFDGSAAALPEQHRRALLTAIDQVIAALPAPVPAAASARLFFPPPEAGRTWRYNVVVEPALWRDATLTYRTVRQGDLAVKTEFRHAGGEMNFDLGVFAPAHPSHANVRFPGFFLYPAYFAHGIEPQQSTMWEWPWQLPDGKVRAGRIKQYFAQVKEWTELRLQGVSYPALRIEATLSYIDAGNVQASAKETFWYMPAVRQVAKIVREGATPDEGATRITAELVEFR